MSRNYKFNNPLKEGLVFRAEDYIYSFAVDYLGGKGIIDDIIVIPHDTIVR